MNRMTMWKKGDISHSKHGVVVGVRSSEQPRKETVTDITALCTYAMQKSTTC